MNVSSATDTPASAIKATLAALRPKKAASTNLLFLNFSSIFEIVIIIMMLGAISPRVAMTPPNRTAVSYPTYVAQFTHIGPGVDSETAIISVS